MMDNILLFFVSLGLLALGYYYFNEPWGWKGVLDLLAIIAGWVGLIYSASRE